MIGHELAARALHSVVSVLRLLYPFAMNRKRLPLALIAAMAQNRVIGRDNQLPWRLPEDLRHFKAKTLGKPVIMGRKTWDSLGRPLPGRLNIVVSRQADLRLDGAEVFPALDVALERADAWAREQGVDELMLIGGAQLYAQALPIADRIYLTRIGLKPEGDAWFPEFDVAGWQCARDPEMAAIDDKPSYQFETWTRSS
jgi:dihydrofolate reductase